MSVEQVILVNENDQQIDLCEKFEAHKKGLLHRAISVFVFNSKNELILQQRALTKYHTPGLWSNTCCTHPRENELPIDAAKRRLMEEMGFVCELTFIDKIIYKAEFDNGLIEHELDHIFIGFFDGNIIPNPKEVNDFRIMKIHDLKTLILQNPKLFTDWFKIIFNKIDFEVFL